MKRLVRSTVTYNKIKYRIQPRRKETTITHLRLGHSMTNAGLQKIGLRDNAVCAICRTSETAKYLLRPRPVQQQRRPAPRVHPGKQTVRHQDHHHNNILQDVIYDWIV